jgi:hypothetical protein
MNILDSSQYNTAVSYTWTKRKDSVIGWSSSSSTSAQERVPLLQGQHTPSNRISAKDRVHQFLLASRDCITVAMQKVQVPIQNLILQRRSHCSHNPATPHSVSNMQLQSTCRHWVMLCLNSKHSPRVVLHQIRVFGTPTNAELLDCLSKEYENRRETYRVLSINIRPFWRQIKAVHFVRFRTLAPSPGSTVQIEDLHSLPGPHQAQSWFWNGMDGIQASTMGLYLRKPSLVGEDWSIYEYIPKTCSPLPPKDGLGGWGLYVEEGMSQERKMLCAIVFLTIGFLIRGLAGGSDRALGMAIASAIIAYMAVIVGAALALY